MASLDVIALDPTVPQLRAPAVGDTYHFCRVVEFQDGTDAAPSITNVGDTNTGIYWPNADELAVSTNGVQRLSLGATTVFNETGADVDFRIEGDTDANLVFVDASTDRVGLGLNNPDRLLDVDGSSKFRGQILITSGEALTLGLQALQLPTGVESTISAGLSTRTGVAGESIIQFGNNMNTYYTGSVNAAKAGAMIRIDTRGVEPTPGASAYSVFQIQTRAAGVADPNYTVPVQIGAAPQGTFCIQTNGLATFNYGFVVNEGGGDYDTRFEGDTDTHLFFADASTDRIGIGTNAPGYKLDVNGTANFANNVTFTGGTANGVLYLNGSKVATSGSVLVFDGTKLSTTTFQANSNTASSFVSRLTNQDFQLYATNGVATSSSGDVKATIGLYYADTLANLNGGIQFTRGGGGTDGWMNFFASGTEQMRLNSTGLGIGTSSPYAALQSAKVTASTPTGGSAAGIGLIVSNSNNAYGMQFGSASAGYGWIQQQRNDGTNTQYDLSLQPLGGNVGIGTSSPASRLHLYTSAAATTLTIDSGTSGTAISYSLAGVAKYTAEYVSGSDFYAIGRSGVAYDLVLKSGNLGLGVTPSAWSTLKAFEFGTGSKNGSLYSYDGDLGLNANVYYKSGTGLSYISNGYATQYRQLDGTHFWQTAASGTAGNAITFTAAMTLDASGRLGIGRTSMTYPLDVQASDGNGIRFTDSNNSVQSFMGAVSSTGVFGTLSNHPTTFWANNAERARITSGGDFLVGTTSSTASARGEFFKSSGSTTLRVKSTIANAETVYFSASNNDSRYADLGVYKHSGITNSCAYVNLTKEDGGNSFLWTGNDDNFRISTAAADIGTNGGTVVGTQTSDERLKNIIGPVQYGLNEVLALQPIAFAMKDMPETKKVGFSAQQVRAVVPEAVYDTGECIDGYDVDPENKMLQTPKSDRTKLAMEYTQIIPVLVNAVKELKAELDAAKAEIAALKGA